MVVGFRYISVRLLVDMITVTIRTNVLMANRLGRKTFLFCFCYEESTYLSCALPSLTSLVLSLPFSMSGPQLGVIVAATKRQGDYTKVCCGAHEKHARTRCSLYTSGHTIDRRYCAVRDCTRLKHAHACTCEWLVQALTRT
jgi:hypothetical protein